MPLGRPVCRDFDYRFCNSEIEFRGHLQLARATSICVCIDHTEVLRPVSHVGRPERGCVGGVEGFQTQLQVSSLGEVDILEKRQISVS